MVDRLPRWIRIVLVAGLAFLACGLSYAAYRFATRPTTLTVATGSIDGDAARLMSALAARIAASKSQVRLKVVDKGTAVAAVKAFSSGEADLAIARPDIGDLSAARTVVLITYGVVLIIAPPGSSIESMADLKGKVVGVIGGDANRRMVETLEREYELRHGKVVFRDLTIPEAEPALASKKIHALLVVTPLSEKYLSLIKGLFPQAGKKQLGLVAIESADAIENVAKMYESYELPKGAVRGNPAIPDEDLTTLKVPYYLVANKKLDDDVVADLAKAVMDARRDLVSEYPVLGQIAAPSTDKDAFVPIHPGAKAYFDGDQKSLFDKYGDQFFYGSMLLGSLTSILAAAWKFMGFGGSQGGNSIADVASIAARIRKAESDAELDALGEDIDAIFAARAAKWGIADDQASEMMALCLSILRLEQLSLARRTTLHNGGTAGRIAQAAQ